jgi:ABC-type nitrate/sulfonate/bicarbonate transport system substrate-binding protein
MKAILCAALLFLCLTASARGAEFTGITMGLGSTSWNTQLPAAVAQQAGFFKEQGLDVRAVTIASGGPVMMALLSSGEAQVVISGAVAILRGIASGAPAVIVGGEMDKPDYALIGAKGLKTVADLKGKVVGSTGAGSFSEFAVIESLRRKGLIRDRDYTLLPIGGTAVRVLALQSGKIQAAPLSSGERVGIEEKGFPVLVEIGRTIPEFPFTVVAATKSFAVSSPDKVASILRALDKANRLIQNDKEAAVQLGKAYGLRGDPQIQRKALNYVANDFSVRLKKEHLSALMNVIGIKKAPEEFFDDSFLNRAFRSR